MEVLELHKNSQYIDQCCMLLNSEWPRSMTARRRGLETSCDNFPTNLILVQKNHVIGHSKISAIPSLPLACFFESVIIHSDLRGRGLGKALMELTENYVKNKHISMAYLSTIDKEGFYTKLGYIKCEPVSIYGSSFFAVDVFNKNDTLPESVKTSVESPAAPPPPPMPVPRSNVIPSKTKVPTISRKIFMKKALQT